MKFSVEREAYATIELSDEQVAHLMPMAERNHLTLERLLEEEPSLWIDQLEPYGWTSDDFTIEVDE